MSHPYEYLPTTDFYPRAEFAHILKGGDGLRIWTETTGTMELSSGCVGFNTSIPIKTNGLFQSAMMAKLQECSSDIETNKMCWGARAFINHHQTETVAQVLIDIAYAHGKADETTHQTGLDSLRLVHGVLFESSQKQATLPEFLGMRTDTKANDRSIIVYFGGREIGGLQLRPFFAGLQKSHWVVAGISGHEPLRGEFQLVPGASLKEAALEILSVMRVADPRRFVFAPEHYGETIDQLLLLVPAVKPTVLPRASGLETLEG